MSQLILDELLNRLNININLYASKEDAIIVIGILLIAAGMAIGYVEGYFIGISVVGLGFGALGVIALLIGIAFKLDKRRRW